MGKPLSRPDVGLEAVHQFALESRLKRAIEKEEFKLFYQPLVDLITGRIVGMEALLRWEVSLTLGMMPPSRIYSRCRSDRAHCSSRGMGAKDRLQAEQGLAECRPCAVIRFGEFEPSTVPSSKFGRESRACAARFGPRAPMAGP